MARKRTAIFGGSFDPPHCGHGMVVSWILSCSGCAETWILPTFQHAFGKDSAPFPDRLAMCRAAFAMFGDAVAVLDLEACLPRPSYTVQTLEHLVAAHPDRDFVLVIGSDILVETPRWKDFDRVKQIAELLVLPRPGSEPMPAWPRVLFPDVSSTAIRSAMSRGEEVRDWVPGPVMDHIRARRLYGLGS